VSASLARWTVEQVVASAPDERVVRAARALARPGSGPGGRGPWSELGSTDALVWGRCQGSGPTPYQVTVDLTEPAFRCSCPSRKQPCKHAVALLLLWVEGSGSVADAEAVPAMVAPPPRPRLAAPARREAVDPEAQARRRAQRLALMDAGIDDFERWLQDLIRQGLASARHQPYGYWDGTASRLVDAQLPGLAERVRAMAGELHRRADWADHLTAEAGRWFLAVRAWRRRDRLDASNAADLRVVLGWPTSRQEALAGERVRDRWLVAGVHRTDDGRLQSQRTWLRGQVTGRWAVILDFAVAGGSLAVAQVTGSVVAGEVALYPGSDPCRAVFAGEARVEEQPAGGLPGGTGVAGALDAFAGALAANPWIPRVPVVLDPVALTVAGSAVLAVEPGGPAVALVDGQDPWPALAITGGHPAALFGEWEHGTLRLLTVVADDALVPV
jgi:hypothetical protein